MDRVIQIVKRYLALLMAVGVTLVGIDQSVFQKHAQAATQAFIMKGDVWRYRIGSSEPPAGWSTLAFDDSGWLQGATEFGFGERDEATNVESVYGHRWAVYTRRSFTVSDPAAVAYLVLKINYDDGFVAYLNGVEVARRNLGSPGTPVYYNTLATAEREGGPYESIDLTAYIGNLVAGTNVLAVQVHNRSSGSTDLSLTPELYWDEQNDVHLLRTPYLQMMGTDTVTIVWTTKEAGPSEVHYGLDQNLGSVAAAASTFKSVSAPAPYDQYYQHEAILSGLQPATQYYYSIYTQGYQLALPEIMYFRTNPASGPEMCQFNFAAIGDSGINASESHLALDQAVARGFDFAVHMGDLAYYNGKYEELEINHFQLFEDILSNQMVWTVPGDHELVTNGGAPYRDVFVLPRQALREQDQERYYSFNYGNAHFIMLDDNYPFVQEIEMGDNLRMDDWLIADLEADDHFWKIVVIHEPAPGRISDTRSHTTQIAILRDIFETYGVDLVLTGHDHLYERTYPIKGDEEGEPVIDEENGVIYVTNGEAGSGGASYTFYDPQPSWSARRSSHLAVPITYDSAYTHIYINGGVMSLITVNDWGEVLDPVGGSEPLVIIDRSDEPGGICSANIQGRVYEDFDGNGAISAGDSPLADVVLRLSNGMTTTTGVDGAYSFDSLATGLYTITQVNPVGFLSSGDVQGANDDQIVVTPGPGETVSGQDFFDYRPVSIQGAVYEDVDGSGGLSAGDTPLSGVELQLSNGLTVTTGMDGVYQFDGLAPGGYTVTEGNPDGYLSSGDAQGGNDDQIAASLASGDALLDQNFFDYRPASIQGTVYEDVDNSGGLSAGDMPLSGVDLQLSNGLTATTGLDGIYQFSGLAPGGYTVAEVNLGGYLSSGDAQGENDDQIAANLASGDALLDQNFFDYRLASIQGTVYEDVDGSGDLSAGDTPMSGVELLLSNGLTATTGIDGVYQFSGLLPGVYTVTEQNLPAYFSSGDSYSSNDDLILLTLHSGQVALAQNFFDYRLASISGAVYEDYDNDYVFSAGDKPLSGITLTLSNGLTTTTNLNGEYQFTGLVPGNYMVAQIDLPYCVSLADVYGANDNLVAVILNSGTQVSGQNFLDRYPRIYLPVVLK